MLFRSVVERKTANAQREERVRVGLDMGSEHPGRGMGRAKGNAAGIYDSDGCTPRSQLVGHRQAHDARSDDGDLHRDILVGSRQ